MVNVADEIETLREAEFRALMAGDVTLAGVYRELARIVERGHVLDAWLLLKSVPTKAGK
jgi:hypothetical protein